jgi:hypothetical protein
VRCDAFASSSANRFVRRGLFEKNRVARWLDVRERRRAFVVSTAFAAYPRRSLLFTAIRFESLAFTGSTTPIALITFRTGSRTRIAKENGARLADRCPTFH